MTAPDAERIDGGDPTFRVEFTIAGSRTLVDGAELLGHSEAVRLARDVFAATTVPILVHVVNERTGFTCDEIVRRPD